MTTENREQTVAWIFRVAIAMCFIGHGAFGIITKSEWLPFFGVVGIGPDVAYRLMPMIGTLDIALGLSVLLRPTRAALVYMTFWALLTASMRPITGLSVFELLERAGNYGVPLAFLLFLSRRHTLVRPVLAVTTALLLIGHGGLAVEGKETLARHVGMVGLPGDALTAVGGFELALGGVLLLAWNPVLLAVTVVWKLGTELFYPLSGAPIWEFIERGGSYGAPLALLVLTLARRATIRARPVPSFAPAAVMMILLTVARPAGGQDRTPIAPAGVADSLRAGGVVLACRHAATNHTESDRGPSRDEQRNLTAEGVDQAKAIGAAIRSLGIPIGDVLANPMFRNQETATHAFGRMRVDSALGGSKASNALRALLVKPVDSGTNRMIVTRIGILSGALQDHGVREIEEGDCFVVRPVDGGDFRVLGRIRAQDWGRLTSR